MRIEARRVGLAVAVACCAGLIIGPAVGHAATLYGATGGNGTNAVVTNSGVLFTINPTTGAATSVGAIGFGITGLAVDPTTGILYGSTTTASANNPDSIVTIDKSTGAGALVGATGQSEGIADIAFDSSGQLWGWSQDSQTLVSIDKASGTATPVGSANGATFGNGMSFDANGTLHAMLDGDNSFLSTIDTSTGDITAGPTLTGSPYGNRAIPAASFGCDGTTLWAIDGLDGAPPVANLVTVDTTTAVITNIGQTTNQMDGLAWDCTPRGTLYGATGGKGDETTPNSGILYTVDPATGAATAVGPIGFGVTGLAVDPTTGVLYGSTTTNSANDPNSIITIDERTGAGTLVGATGRSSGLADIAFDASGQLWGWGADTPLDLETVDKTTGAATSVGGSGVFGQGMSFDGSGTLFGMFNGDDGDLSTVDTSNGDQTTVATLSGSPFGDRAIPAASFACDGATLYAIDGLEQSPPLADLVTVDTTTAAITDIGPTTDQMDGLAWDCVPPPGSLYGATGGNGEHTANSGVLYQLDPATGVVTTTIGSIGFGVTGLAVDPTTGILYGSTTSNSSTDPDSIVTINKATGAGTLVGPTGEASGVADIAFDSSGQLWGWSEDGDFFVSIDKTTGAATHEAHTGSSGDGMSFDRNDVLYAMLNDDDGDLRRIDTATGNTTFVANLTGSPYGDRSIPAASFACDGRTLFAIDGLDGQATAHLVKVSTSSGAITDIGPTADSTDGLAFDCLGFVAPSGGGGGGAPSPPIVTAISPASGPAGTSVGITGQHFENVTQVLFGSTPATFVIDGFNHLTAVAPAGPAGGVDVHVVTGNGTSPSTAADVFNYTAVAGAGGGGTVTTPAPAKCPHVPNLNHRTIRGARKYMDRAGCNVSLKLANHLPRKHHKRRRVVSQSPAAGSSTDGAVTVTMGYLKALKKG